MEIKEIDLREVIACINHLKQGHNGSRKYEIGIVTEKIPALSYMEVGTIVVFYEYEIPNDCPPISRFLVVEQPDMKNILKTKNTIVGVPSKFITRIVLE